MRRAGHEDNDSDGTASEWPVEPENIYKEQKAHHHDRPSVTFNPGSQYCDQLGDSDSEQRQHASGMAMKMYHPCGHSQRRENNLATGSWRRYGQRCGQRRIRGKRQQNRLPALTIARATRRSQ